MSKMPKIIISFKNNVISASMKTITLNVPDSLEINNREFLMIVAIRLYEQEKLSLGQDADLAGFTKRTFAKLLYQYNVSIFNFPATDLAVDVKNA